MHAEQAKAYVDELYQKVEQRWQDWVLNGALMRQMRAGTLPIETFAFLFRNGSGPRRDRGRRLHPNGQLELEGPFGEFPGYMAKTERQCPTSRHPRVRRRQARAS